MSRFRYLTLALVCALGSGPAAAVTYVLGGTVGTPTSLAVTPSGTTNQLVLSGRIFIAPPSTLHNTSQFLGTAHLGRSSAGVGVCSEGGSPGGMNDCAQVDSAGLFNEALQISFTTASSLTSMRLSMVDNNDTLRLYGLGANGALDLLGFGGDIASGLGAFASSTFVGSQDGGTYDVNFTPTALYHTFFLTQNNDGGDGVRLSSLTVGPMLPEPETWALMFVGFCAVGMRLRRPAVLRSTIS